jgi:DNA-binding CsgD family transcriptional regulator
VTAPSRGTPLTDTEARVLGFAADGCTNAAIGERMHLAEDTIKSIMRSVNKKLGTATRGEAALYAYRTGLLRYDEATGATVPIPAAAAVVPKPRAGRRGAPVVPAPVRPVMVQVPQAVAEALFAVAENVIAGKPSSVTAPMALRALTAAGRRGPGGRPLIGASR